MKRRFGNVGENDKPKPLIDITKGCCDMCIHEQVDIQPTKYTLNIGGKTINFCKDHLKAFLKIANNEIPQLLNKGVIDNENL